MKLIIVSIFFYVTTLFFNGLLSNESTKKVEFIYPPKNVILFTFGYSDVFADSLWIRFIQDMGACGIESSDWNIQEKHTQIETELCEKGWSFRMLDAVTDLAPRFGQPYYNGAAVMSLLGKDKIGTGLIFEKGVKNIPNDWLIAYRGGFHFMSEIKDYEKAADMLKQAAENGGPSWLYSLAGQLYTKSGRALYTKVFLESFIKENPDHRYVKRFKSRLLEAENSLGLTNEKPKFLPFSGFQEKKSN